MRLFLALLFLLSGAALAQTKGLEPEKECANITRLNMLMIGSPTSAKSFKVFLQEATPCRQVSHDNDGGIQFDLDAGNLEQINPRGIITELNHDVMETNAPQPLIPATKLTRQSCLASMIFIPECIAGVTSTFDENKIRIPVSKLKGKKVLSIGEGFAGTVENLLETDIDAYGIDVNESYKDPKKTQLLSRHPSHYAWGDATNLKDHALVKIPPDYIFSFCLICTLGPERGAQAIVEGVKALKPGGDLRFSYLVHSEIGDEEHNYSMQMIQNAAKTLDSLGIPFEVYSARVDYLINPTAPRAAQFIMFHKPGPNERSAQRHLSCPSN